MEGSSHTAIACVAFALCALASGCSGEVTALDAGPVDAGVVPSRDAGPPENDAGPPDAGAPIPPGPLEVQFLGVGGFLLRHGDDAVLTAPLYSNPNLLATVVGETPPDLDRIARFSADVDFSNVRAIVVGHAHYDHLMDVPYVWSRTADATVYGNLSMQHVMAAFAPDRAAFCAGTPEPTVTIPRERVVALDDLGSVDYRMCTAQGTTEGDWVYVEGANVRIRALCSAHPDQFLGIHFGDGEITMDLCEPPARAADWLEGATLAYLVDFLDASGAPVHRVYYQDAPTTNPVGYVPPALLAEKTVDVALLCVGNYNSIDVEDHPRGTLQAMGPRYTIGGHWEDFFRPQDEPIQPLAFHDIDEYIALAEEGLGAGVEPAVRVDGTLEEARQWVPLPGTRFEVPAEGTTLP